MASKSSGELINYTLRPKKQIERKILINCLRDIFSQLSITSEISKYRYVGMGSYYYHDFIMFHKYLNVQKMTSLDKHWTKKRFKFNRPYDFIDFYPKTSFEFIKSFYFSEPVIIWFDYDYMLYSRRKVDEKIIDTEILQELQLIQTKLKKNDILLLTVNARYPGMHRRGREELEWIFENYRLFIPNDIKKSTDITEENFCLIIQNIIINCLTENQKFSKIKLKKIISFKYSDGVPMYTFGCIATDDIAEIDSLSIPYINTAAVTITNIDVPNLTIKEKIYLDSQIVALTNQVSQLKPNVDKLKKLIPAEFELNYQELIEYIDFYKYYPQYFESFV